MPGEPSFAKLTAILRIRNETAVERTSLRRRFFSPTNILPIHTITTLDKAEKALEPISKMTVAKDEFNQIGLFYSSLNQLLASP